MCCSGRGRARSPKRAEAADERPRSGIRGRGRGGRSRISPLPPTGAAEGAAGGPQHSRQRVGSPLGCAQLSFPHSFSLLTLAIITNPGGADARERSGCHGVPHSESRCLAGWLLAFGAQRREPAERGIDARAAAGGRPAAPPGGRGSRQALTPPAAPASRRVGSHLLPPPPPSAPAASHASHGLPGPGPSHQRCLCPEAHPSSSGRCPPLPGLSEPPAPPLPS